MKNKKLMIALIIIGVVVIAAGAILLINNFTNPTGTLNVRSNGVITEPYGLKVFRFKPTGDVDDLLAPEVYDIADTLKTIVYADDFEVIISGPLDSFETEYVTYSADGREELMRGNTIGMVDQPGNYIVRADVCYGEMTNFTQYFYYFKLEVPAV